MYEYYDREKLYTEVWEKPMSEVCKSYGISDVALKKTCKKLRVATPPGDIGQRRMPEKNRRNQSLSPLKIRPGL